MKRKEEKLVKIAYKSLAKRTRAISNAMPSISLQSRRKNLVIASRLFTKFMLNSLWKRTKLTSGRKGKIKGKRTRKMLQNAFHSFERDSLYYGNLACDRKS